MKEKLKEYLGKIAAKLTHAGAKPSMRIVCYYGIGLAAIVLLLIMGWVYQWYRTGIPDISSLIGLFHEYTAPTVVAAVTFLSVFHVDKNRDGRPDVAEEQVKKK